MSRRKQPLVAGSLVVHLVRKHGKPEDVTYVHLWRCDIMTHADAKPRPPSPALTFTMKALIAGLLLGALALGCGPADSALAATEATETVEASLSSSIAADLTFIRQEEKLARDVYLALGEKWGLPIFSNIAQSEQQHMDVMLTMLSRYRLPDPVAGHARGVFVDPFLQDLYGRLIARGEESLVEALKVGADIEDLDIVDIRTRLGSSPPRDVTNAYQNLMKASRNHLRSFVGQLTSRGATFTPTYLTLEEYQAIISTPKERGPY